MNIQSGGQPVRSLVCMLVLAVALANGIVSYRILPDPNDPAWYPAAEMEGRPRS